MKKLFCVFLVLTMLFTFTACGGDKGTTEPDGEKAPAAEGEAPQEQVVLKLGHCYAESSHLHKAAVLAKERLEELSGGTMSIDIHPNSILGSENEMTEMVRMNTLDMHISADFYFQGDYPQAVLEELGFLFDSAQSWYDAMDGELGAVMQENVLGPAGVKALGWWSVGMRQMTNNVRPIVEPIDVKGVKFRTANSVMRIKMFECFGGSAVAINFNELFTALQQGTVDGQEGPLSVNKDSSFDQVQKYCSMTGHIHTGCPVIINSSVYDGLTAEQQGWLNDAMAEATTYERELADQLEKELRAYFEGTMEVNDVNHEAFLEAVQPVYDLYAEEYGPREWIDLAQSYNG